MNYLMFMGAAIFITLGTAEVIYEPLVLLTLSPSAPPPSRGRQFLEPNWALLPAVSLNALAFRGTAEGKTLPSVHDIGR